MTIKRWLYLFFTTLAVGGGTSIMIGIMMEWGALISGGWANFLVGLLGHFWIGLMYSAVSQMGFFAYLTVNQFGLGVTRKREIWALLQIGLILFTFYDFVYLRYQFFGENGNWLSFVWLPLSLLMISFLAAYLKMKETNRSAFVPAVFFMFVVTTIEAVPVLRENNVKALLFMMVPLITCNIWQLMLLHRLNEPKKDEVQANK